MPTRLYEQLAAYRVLQRNPLELWGEPAYEREIVASRFVGRDQLLLNAPEAIRHVLVTNHENYGRAVGSRRVLQPVLGEGLLLAQGESWKHQRRTIAPAFAPRMMPVLAQHVIAASEDAEAELERRVGQRIELLPAMQNLALDIAGQSMFSLEMDGFGQELRSMLMGYAQHYARASFFDLVLPLSVPSPLDFGRARFRERWLPFMDRLIDARVRRTRAEPDRPRDLLDLLTAARDPETGAAFDRALLRDDVSTLILAGHETTSVTLFWACYIAAKMPEHQARIADEAATVDLSAENAAEALRSLPYTRAFIDETLRLYPPAFLILRRALGRDRVAGRDIGPGTVISIAPWVLHRHRRLWSNPEYFDPGRFLPGAVPPDRYSYMPFGAGPRICVGAQFALTEATLVLARLIRLFQIDLVGDGAVMPRGLITTQPDRPVHFVLNRRPPRVERVASAA